MAGGYDLDRYRDVDGVKGVPRVLHPATVVLAPIHKEAPPEKEEPGDRPRGNIELRTAILTAPAPAGRPAKPPGGGANVERSMVVMARTTPKRPKPTTMADVKI
jgi:hypothetical protein